MSKQNKKKLSPLEARLHHLKMLLWACRGAVALGFGTSAAGNVLHAEKAPIPIGISLTAPVILLVAFEFMSRIPLPSPDAGKLRWIGTGIRILAMGTIAVIMMILSYRHQSEALMVYGGGDHLQATLLPGAIDAFMIVGSLSVIEVQIFIRNTELKIEGIDLAKAKAMETAEKPKEKAPTQRERIAMAMTAMPWATPREIAASLGNVKETYAANVMSELKKTQQSNGANGKAVPVHN